ncbi:TPA: hypothetical protein O4694_000525 [Staphylococcus aureus]|nr:hypothetical protein [Staphylococcus aureus]
MKQKIIMFTLVTVILFCAVLIGYQIPKQQVKMKQNQIEDLQEEQRILRDKNDLYDDITVNDIHVYFDTYDPKKDSYKVFVQFDERIETDGDDKIEHRQTSAQLDLVRTAEGWRIDNLKRFNLKPLGR